MYLLETANSMFLSIRRVELLNFEHGNPISHKMSNIILWLFCWRTFKFLSISRKLYLFLWEKIDSSIFVYTS